MDYPSLCDNNIFQRTVVSEVLYKAEQLKKEWLESRRNEERDFASCEEMLPLEVARQVSEEEEVYKEGHWVFVPLVRVWAGSKVQALCSNIQRLRDVLLVDVRVHLDTDRDAIMLPDYYEQEENKEDLDEAEQTEHVLRSFSNNVEDWESEL